MSDSAKLLNKLGGLGPVLGLCFVVLVFSIGADGFFSGTTLKIISVQSVITCIAALGMTLIIISGGIDLSVGSIIAFSSVLGALALNEGWSLALAVPVTIGGGLLFGLINGLIIARAGMSPFIVTLGMMGIARGAAQWAASNQTVYLSEAAAAEDGVVLLMNNPPGSVPYWVPPIGVGIALVLALLVAFALNRTVFGRRIFAIGSNEATARLCGISVRNTKLWVYLAAGFLYGLAGLMQLSRLGQGDPMVAVGLELDVIAAVVIGGASLNGGVGSIFGTVIGALIMAVLRNGTQQMGWENHVQLIMIGAVIILAVGLDKWRHGRG